MNTSSPFSFLHSLATRLQPPSWLVDEVQQRVVLLLNHVLMQEPEAQNRLARKKGSVLHVSWGVFVMDLLITPAGLFDRAPVVAKPDLSVAVAADSPFSLAQSVLAGKAPPVKIEGDVQLAAELGWLAENLRWDVEEDLSRLLGDIPAHTLADAGRKLLAGLKQFLAKNPLTTQPDVAAADTSTASSVSAAATVQPDTARATA